MNTRSLIAALIAGALLSVAHASEPAKPAAVKPDPAKGAPIAQQQCAACHGADGNSSIAANPPLAGQNAAYLARQLQEFKEGTRVNPIMKAQVDLIPNASENFAHLGAYFATQKAKPKQAKDRQAAELGGKIYRGGRLSSHLPACMACHGPSGAGMPKQFPRVAGQSPEYVTAQLQAFKNGTRGKNAKGEWTAEGRMMNDVANKLSSEDIKNVAEFISGLR